MVECMTAGAALFKGGAPGVGVAFGAAGGGERR